MTSVATELEKHFGILVNSKPPGSQRGQVEAITTIAETHIESESVVVSALVRYLKRAPITHKLGAVYIFDSVLRRWIEKAKTHGQLDVSSADEHGTFAAGVARIRDVIEPLVLDVIRVCPADQRDKVKRLVMIWERSGALPGDMLSTFKKALDPPVVDVVVDRSTTPRGSPPPGLVNGLPSRTPSLVSSANVTPNVIAPAVVPAPPAQPQAAANNATSILSRLAAIAQTSNNPLPVPSSSTATSSAPSAFVPPNVQPVVSTYNGYYNGASNGHANNGYGASAPTVSQPVIPLGPAPLPALVPGLPAQPPATAPPVNPIGALPPAQAAALATLMSIPGFQNSLQATAGASSQLNPAIAAILQTLALGAPAAQAAQPQQDANQFSQFTGRQPPTGPQADRDFGRSPPRRGRDRSRSPSGWDRNGHSDERNGNGRNEYRERSPASNIISSSVPIRPKWIEFDKTMPPNHIRVLSRTLFIGGVNYTEPELHDIFANFGEVQSCIVNKDKRHAFVKMLYRDMAARAMDEMKSPEYQHYGLRTRWGVGFGPRDCSDYNTGVSIIPIPSLTDADVKWMHTAQFGGCGDMEIASGMCVEEPDIEIGAGVSSKAISRRIQTDRGGSFGPRSTRSEMASAGPRPASTSQAPPLAPTAPQAVANGNTTSGSQAPPTAPTGPQRGNVKNSTPPTAPTAPQGFPGGHGRGGRGHHDGPPRGGGRGRGGFRERGRPRRDFDTPQQFGQGFDYGANY